MNECGGCQWANSALGWMWMMGQINLRLMSTRRQLQPQSGKSDKKKEEPVVVEVQFCSNCDAHLFTVRHQEAKYYAHYDAIRKRLHEEKIIVKRRPVPDNLYKKSPYCPANVFYKVDSNEVVYFPEIGSFEVYFHGKKIFSKLDTLKWPSPEAILAEIQKCSLPETAKSNELTSSQPNAQTERPTKKDILVLENKKDEERKRPRQLEQHLAFRYSIDRRNLFKKPQHNYLQRKSMTARNQNVSESTNRNNYTAHVHKNINDEEILPIPISQENRKELTDEAVLQMYKKKQEKVEGNANLPEITKKVKKNGQVQGNIYLQPIFPKSNINLENYIRQKMIIANKIHEQRKSYEASKHQKEIDRNSHPLKAGLNLKAKFNQNCNQLLKGKEKAPAQLHNIKERTEENESNYKAQAIKPDQLQKGNTQTANQHQSNQPVAPKHNIEVVQKAAQIHTQEHPKDHHEKEKISHQEHTQHTNNHQQPIIDEKHTHPKLQNAEIHSTHEAKQEIEHHQPHKQLAVQNKQVPIVKAVENVEKEKEQQKINTQQNAYQAEFEEQNQNPPINHQPQKEQPVDLKQQGKVEPAEQPKLEQQEKKQAQKQQQQYQEEFDVQQRQVQQLEKSQQKAELINEKTELVEGAH